MTSRKKSIGMLSTQFTINYGAVLQSYSLFNVLKKLKNVRVTTIDYAPKSARYGHYEKYNFSGLKNAILSVLKIVNFTYRLSRHQKKEAFQYFVSQEFSLTDKTYCTNDELLGEKFFYDLAIVGSDQVWNPKVINDPSFYLNFIDASKTIKSSYAASLGGELSSVELAKLVEHVSDFTKISFREPIQINELESRTNMLIDVLVDPVLLTSKNEWLELARKSTLESGEPYILIYEVNSPPGFKKYVDFLKTNSQLRIVEISTRPFSKYSGVETISNGGPYDFVNLFAGAQYVLTSSFHGVAFSCVLNKPFSCVLNKERSTRQRHLLENLDLEFCEINQPTNTLNNMSHSFDWNSVNENIDKFKSTSDKFLNELLNNVNKIN